MGRQSDDEGEVELIRQAAQSHGAIFAKMVQGTNAIARSALAVASIALLASASQRDPAYCDFLIEELQSYLRKGILARPIYRVIRGNLVTLKKVMREQDNSASLPQRDSGRGRGHP